MRRRAVRTPGAGIVLVVGALLLAGCDAGGGSDVVSPTTLEGRVVSAPACPVEVAGSPCPPRAVERAEVTAEQGGVVLDSTTTAADGSFRLALAPGIYRVTATVATGFRSRASTVVQVPLPADEVPLVLTVDSGIR